MEVFEGNRESRRGRADWFDGEVWIDMLIANTAPLTLSAARVSFAPGARTAWHTHPRGQGIHILSGVCRAQKSGGEIRELHTGDSAWFAPDEVHWHGAGPGQTMVHLAMQMADDTGINVVWMEHVDENNAPNEPSRR